MCSILIIRHSNTKIANIVTMASAGARPRVLVVHNDTPQSALDLLKTKCDVTLMRSNWPTTNEILKVIPEHDALFGVVPIDAKFLDAAGNRLKIISTPTAGFDHLHVAEIKKRGAARRAHEGRLQLEQGKTGSGFSWLLGHDLRNKTVGIVGLGNIGVEILKRLKPFEIKKFVYTGHSRKQIGDELGAEFVSLDDLLKQSDFVIDSVPLNSETEEMFDDDAFKKMKKTAVFVNIGRGKTVHTDALVRALKNATIFAAGLDVTEPEPLPVDHELLQLPNVVIVPHMGTQTIETENDMAIAAVQNILYSFDGKPLLYEI
ncbi:glyoxylate reductase/hydroxypyruvate reductase-like isoform X3 [Phymastichus coffea]|uniref:glyoxylate reductase/hydroxypyruvate reductase-like isoform X3 n=1 Tax=Phymastichus coffea TaxID=108790 RepID=UPI00273B6002|nr:glyoxylate reductase/hydroxypyruvate reductase-like isoform X3 [Phymastichus coffea]